MLAPLVIVAVAIWIGRRGTVQYAACRVDDLGSSRVDTVGELPEFMLLSSDQSWHKVQLAHKTLQIPPLRALLAFGKLASRAEKNRFSGKMSRPGTSEESG